MPDFSTQAVAQFWNQYRDRAIYRVVAFMEGVEEWTLDGDPNIEVALQRLGQELDNLSKVDLEKLGQKDLFIYIGNAIKSGRTLRLLQAIDAVHPGSASKLLIYSEESSKNPDDPPGLFLRRNIVFERLRLLSRVFSPARFALVLKAMEGEYEA